MKTEMKTTTSVKGGYIKRSNKTGRFVEVTRTGAKESSSAGSLKETTRSSQVTFKAVKEASSRRSDALKRLADR